MTVLYSAWAKAPGKVIIAGEHAVIYGQPALASASHLSTHAACTWQPFSQHSEDQKTDNQPSGKITLALPQYQWQASITNTQLQVFSQQVMARHQIFLQGDITQQQVLPEAGDLLLAAVGFACYHTTVPELDCLAELVAQADIHIHFTTDLVLGAGMGSSASLVAACLGALLTTARHVAKDYPVQKAEGLARCTTKRLRDILYELTFTCEQWQHGRSSGLDPHVCIYGGGWQVQKDQRCAVVIPTCKAVYLVNTGIPQSSTGECVQYVAAHHKSTTPWSLFGELAQQLVALFADFTGEKNHHANYQQQCITIMRDNQRLLEQLGIVPDKVMAFARDVEQHQGAAKVSGAGSLQGDAGGVMLVVGIAPTVIAELCASYGYDYWSFQPNTDGVTVGLSGLSAMTNNLT